MERLGRKPTARLFLCVLAVALLGAPATAHALLITGADYGTLSSIGALYNGDTTTSSFMTPDLTGQGGPAPVPIGTLTSSVYYNGSLFTYVLAVTPSIANETRLSTGFLPTLSNNSAGWSFANAVAAGAPAPGNGAYTIILNTTNLSWTATAAATAAGLWTAANETVDFFFQSTLAPQLLTYNLGGVQSGTATGYGDPPATAVPEPRSLLLLASGVFGVLLASRRLRRSQLS